MSALGGLDRFEGPFGRAGLGRLLRPFVLGVRTLFADFGRRWGLAAQVRRLYCRVMTATQGGRSPLEGANPAEVKGRSRHRFFCPSLASLAAGGQANSDRLLPLDREQSHHARRVLKMPEGEAVELFDGEGWVGFGTLASGHTVSVDGVHRVPPAGLSVSVATAWPKGARADTMITTLSQLGADRVIPVRTARSVAHPSETRRLRYEKLAIESAKQCRRAYVMRIAPVAGIESVMNGGEDVRLMACPGPDAQCPWPRSRVNGAASVLILIGPEGGWSVQEKKLARQLDFEPWRLGPHVMRIETAAVAAVAVVRYHALQTPQAL